MMKPTYPRPVNLTKELESAWQTHKRLHPGDSFNGLVRHILTDYFTREGVLPCANAVPSSTIP